MADEGEKVVEEKPEQNEEVRTEMLPPELPKSIKKEVKSNKLENEAPNTEEDDEKTTKMAPPLQDVKSEEELATEKIKKREDKKENFPEIPYKEPSWSGIPDEPYYLELLKGGCIKSTKYLTEKPYYLFGRLPNCDIVMEHPSISRYHAVIQYKASQTGKSDKGFYLYDLGSTHGTVVNKIQIEPKRYYRLRVGYVIKFGGSSRLYIIQGPEEVEEEEEEEETMKEQQEGSAKLSNDVGKVMSEEEYEEWKQQKEKKPEEKDEGISWGFGEDAVEEDIINPFASELEGNIEIHEFKDAKKTLRGFFEREGLDLEYKVEETGPGHARVYHCRVKLPVETATGDPLYAEAAVTGKKREAVLACATEACRILDLNGLLRQSSHESKKQKMKNWEDNDYYDSDEDTFLDRTGSIEKKRVKRMKIAKRETEEAETFESLSSKLKSVEEEIASLETKLQEAMQASKTAKENEDSLDSYMKTIDKCMDKTARMQMRRKIFDLKKEKQQLAKLVKVAQPTSLPELLVPKLSSEGVKGMNEKTEEKTISTPSAATGTPYQAEHTTEAGSSMRHEQAVLDDKGSSKESVSSHDPNNKTTASEQLQNSGEKIESEGTKFAMPALPSSKNSKPKQKKTPPPDSSLSRVLEGLKSGSINEKDAWKERRFKKHHPVEEQSEALQEPIEKKKRKIMPQFSPTSPPPSPPEPTQTESSMDENYSDWIPPTDQSGDGRTKLNEKYGY